jgi:hypothetical protein
MLKFFKEMFFIMSPLFCDKIQKYTVLIMLLCFAYFSLEFLAGGVVTLLVYWLLKD